MTSEHHATSNSVPADFFAANPAAADATSPVPAIPAQADPAPATNPVGVLDDIMARVGVDGLVAALENPGLMAAVDQHVAAVRDSLEGSGLEIGTVPLAGYASSVAAAAVRMGRELPDPASADWSRATWFQLRLMAVCALAIGHDCV